ncbi:hypothetical protein B0H19DRAFT_687558 [Mycena capillaripes]|nr:hypothetical protein B0H19DRAFT_687558 [Mycena capillaripes]
MQANWAQLNAYLGEMERRAADARGGFGRIVSGGDGGGASGNGFGGVGGTGERWSSEFVLGGRAGPYSYGPPAYMPPPDRRRGTLPPLPGAGAGAATGSRRPRERDASMDYPGGDAYPYSIKKPRRSADGGEYEYPVAQTQYYVPPSASSTFTSSSGARYTASLPHQTSSSAGAGTHPARSSITSLQRTHTLSSSHSHTLSHPHPRGAGAEGRDRSPSPASDDLDAILLESAHASPRPYTQPHPHPHPNSSSTHPASHHPSTTAHGGETEAGWSQSRSNTLDAHHAQGQPSRAESVDNRAYPPAPKKGGKDLHAFSAAVGGAGLPLATSFPPTNAANQRICRQCGQPGRYKEGKCVEKWGPGPLGPGTVCDRCVVSHIIIIPPAFSSRCHSRR